MALADFAIYPLDVGGGQVALSQIPGRNKTYEADLSLILHWRPDIVLTMTGSEELDRVGATDFGSDLEHAGVIWHHLPIVDFSTPSPDIEARWANVSVQCGAILANGGRILSHCFGGCGRSGMMALRLMVEAGESPQAALARLRQVRPCAVEKDDQFIWAGRAV